MKRLRTNINAASDAFSGTVYYTVTLDQLYRVVRDNDFNIFAIHALESEEWDAIDVDGMYGSRVIDDILYICVTDGELISVGEEVADPESALLEYSTDDLVDYIQPSTDKIVKKYITEYEVVYGDLTNSAIDLLDSGYSFYDLYTAAQSVPELMEVQ